MRHIIYIEVNIYEKCVIEVETVRHYSAEVPERHFGAGAELSGHFGTSLMVPKCLGSEVSWVRSVLTPDFQPAVFKVTAQENNLN